MSPSPAVIKESGLVRSVRKDIARITGLYNCMNGEVLDIDGGAKAMVMGFNNGEALALILSTAAVRAGDRAYSRMKTFEIPVGRQLIGKVTGALGQAESGMELRPVFRPAPQVLDRVPITEAFETGILAIDAMIPIGKGQRQLIIGDRMTGKTGICVDTILNQKGKDVICVYCSIGHDDSSLKKILSAFSGHGALDYTIIVSAPASCPVGEKWLSPYTACAIGEYFMEKGMDVFIAFDDLTKHAWAYRQISLLLERSPGRDAYPGDIFYLHSQLMERAGRLKPGRGGSMTFFPVVDTLQGDVSGYIPSNLISMTDGQIYLSPALFNSGFRPAIDLGLSVSRIGNKVQCPSMRSLSSSLRLDYLQYTELSRMVKFKPSISDDISARLSHGQAATRLFIQERLRPRRLAEQAVYLDAYSSGILDGLTGEESDRFKDGILDFAESRIPGLSESVCGPGGIPDDIAGSLKKCYGEFFGS